MEWYVNVCTLDGLDGLKHGTMTAEDFRACSRAGQEKIYAYLLDNADCCGKNLEIAREAIARAYFGG